MPLKELETLETGPEVDLAVLCSLESTGFEAFDEITCALTTRCWSLLLFDDESGLAESVP